MIGAEPGGIDPLKPNIPGIEHAITSREMFQLQQLPKRLVIVGGGYIGGEFSSMMIIAAQLGRIFLQAATVGIAESKAREQFGESVQCYRTQFEPLFHSITQQNEQAMIKLVVDGDSKRVLGAHMVGGHVADVIQSLAVAIRKGITKQDIDETIGIHPTTGEEFLTLD